MKLRIKGNSIRLRLTKTEVAEVKAGAMVTETVSFGANELCYYLEPSSLVSSIEARFESPHLRILLPAQAAHEWATTDTVALQHHQKIGQATPLFILIEKDFFCLKPRAHQVEDESDLFFNPNYAHGSCG